MALSVTSVTPSVITVDGGYPITVAGTFVLTNPLYLYLGATGTVADAACYSGVAGQGNACYALTTSQLIVFTPLLALGLSAYNLLVVSPQTSEQVKLSNAFTVRPAEFATQVYSLRSVLPSNYATGPRSLDREAAP